MVVVVADVPEDDFLKTVRPAEEEDAFTRYHVPPRATMPSPLDCSEPLSPAKVYNGKELNVTCFIVELLVTKPIFPFTLTPSVTLVTEPFTSSGGHVERHALLHLIFAPFSELSMYNVLDE